LFQFLAQNGHTESGFPRQGIVRELALLGEPEEGEEQDVKNNHESELVGRH
jgi:hypothetical protein